MEIAQDHRVFLLGEYHGGQRIPELTKALIDTLYHFNYNRHAAEIGPISASILNQQIGQQKPVDVLTSLNDTYWEELQEDYPIPFFNGPQDAEMLNSLKALNIQLHGLDQEYYNSFPMLIQQLKKVECEIDMRLLDETLEMVQKAYITDAKQDRFDMCGHILKNDTLIRLEEALVNSNCDSAISIMSDIKASLDIYSRNYQRGGYSHQKRITYIRSNFKRIWNQMNPNDKLLVRIGGLHTARGTRLSSYDLGDLTNAPQYSSVSFSCSSRYYKEGNTINDYWADRSYSDIEFSFRKMGRMDEWVLIDLKLILNDWKKGKILLPDDHSYHMMRQTIEGYVYLLIAPLDEDQEVLLSENEKE